MLFILRFHDKPGLAALRRALLPAHIAWLDAHRDQVRVGGSLRHTPEADPIGGCWIVEAGSKAEAESLYLSDPFFVEGLRASVEVLHWSKALPDRKVEV